MEELESALKKYNMGDEKTIKEIIAEVDTDNVCFFFLLYSIIFHCIKYNQTLENNICAWMKIKISNLIIGVCILKEANIWPLTSDVF